MKYNLYKQYDSVDLERYQDTDILKLLFNPFYEYSVIPLNSSSLFKLDEIKSNLMNEETRLKYLNDEFLVKCKLYSAPDKYNKEILIESFNYDFAIHINEQYKDKKIVRLNITDEGSVNIYYQGEMVLEEVSDDKFEELISRINSLTESIEKHIADDEIMRQEIHDINRGIVGRFLDKIFKR